MGEELYIVETVDDPGFLKGWIALWEGEVSETSPALSWARGRPWPEVKARLEAGGTLTIREARGDDAPAVAEPSATPG